MQSYIERPVFQPDQTLSDEDLDAIVAYARDGDRRHRLGSHTWGIVHGLELVEQDEAGKVAVLISPGVAVDGFGRAIVVERPFRIAEATLADQTDPLVPIHIGYEETVRDDLRWAASACCNDPDGFRRLAEGFAVRAGRLASVREHHDALLIGPSELEDAREVRRLLDPEADLLCDGSVPFQSLADQAPVRRWWIPLGQVAWIAGAPGRFDTRSEAALVVSRTLRRHAGLVTEDLLAAEGTIRLRRRLTERPAVGSVDDACRPTHLAVADLTAEDGEVAPIDLISLEGDTRALGEVKLFGTRLEFRLADGFDDDVPLYLRRGEAPDGHQLEAVLGEATGPQNRLAVGTASDFGTLSAQFVVLADGRTGIGTEAPDDYAGGADDLVIARTGDAGLTVATPQSNVGTIHFADGTSEAARVRGFVRYEHATDDLVLGAAGEPRLTVDQSGNVGIGTATPSGGLHVTAGTAVSLASGTGRLVLNEVDDLNLAMDGNEIQARNNGAASTLHLNARGGDVRFHNNLPEVQRVVLTEAGAVGIGTTSPATPLHLAGTDPDITLDISSTSPNRRCELRLAEDGATRSRVFWDRLDDRLYLENRGAAPVSVRGSDLGVGLGTGTAPATRLHVRGEINENAADPSDHVALIENVSTGTNADVLALRVGTGFAGAANNFITFFNGAGPIGAIQGSANTISLNTTGADFAEVLPLAEPGEAIEPGDVVGVFAGKVRRATAGADAVMVATTAPAVLGNAKPGERGVGITLMGQTPVRVSGPVRAGELLVASGAADGTARALDRHKSGGPIIGRAWSDAADGRVVAAVGIAGAGGDPPGASSQDDRARIARLEAELAELRARLGELIDGPADDRDP